MFVFRKNLRRAIAASPYAKSISRLSVEAALGEKTLGNMLNSDAVDIAKAGPGIFGMKRVADLLGVSLDSLVGNSDASRPLPATFMDRFKATGAMIEGFTDLLPFLDLYHPAKAGDTELKVYAQGAQSLSALMMPSASTKALQGVFDNLKGTALLASTIDDHLICNRKGCFASFEELDSLMPADPVKIKIDYVRVLARLQSRDGAAYTLNYCFRL